MSRRSEFDCGRARRAIHACLDGEVDGATAVWLEKHLAACEVCRRFESDLMRIHSALATLPQPSLPDDALESVWSRTTRLTAAPDVGEGREAPRNPMRDWRSWAVAAALALALVGLWVWNVRDGAAPPPRLAQSAESQPSEAELRQAAEQARMVLGLTARALRRTEQAAVRDVLGGDVSRVLQQLPVDWPPVTQRPTKGSEL